MNINLIDRTVRRTFALRGNAIPHIAESAFMLAFALSFSLPARAQVQWSGNGHVYMAVSTPTPITWTQANAAAQTAGGYLATITSASENAFVFSLIDNPIFWGSDAGGQLGPFLGGLQPVGSPEPAGGWQWVTGETWSFTNWAPGEPSNGVGSPSGQTEDRLHFFGAGSSRSSQWNDYPTGVVGAKGYVVEFNSASAPEPATIILLAFGTVVIPKCRAKKKRYQTFER